MPSAFPTVIRTPRLLLRAWRATDSDALRPVLEANVAHLSPWIPPHVWSPAPLGELATRLATFASEFADNRAWRYALFTSNESMLLGELALFPRDAHARVAMTDANRVEIGYWLRTDCTGHGFATEAASAALTIVDTISRFAHAEIRCDARNAPSAAVPLRLGFTLADTIEEPPDTEGEPPVALQIWALPLHALSRAPSSSSNSLV